MELAVFYNVENFFVPDKKPVHKFDPTVSGLHNWDERRYQNKLHKISGAFRLMKEESNILPLFIGLSEISGRQTLEDLIKLPPFDSEFGIAHFDSLDERKIDVALLYDKRKVELLHAEPITFFFEKDYESKEPFDTTRDVLYCKLSVNEEIIHVFVLHLPSKREKDINLPKRAFILNEIKNRISDLIKNENAKVLVCGDFNENPDDEKLRSFLSNENKQNLMTNPFAEMYADSQFSAYHHKNGLLFDQIILSQNFFHNREGLQFHDAGIFKPHQMTITAGAYSGRPFRTYAGTRYLGGFSDHFPVFVLLDNLPKDR
jgi:hypothetical protein